MAKQILDAQVMYFLEHNKFFPEDGSTVEVFHNSSPALPQIEEFKNALKVQIPVGHFLDFTVQADNSPGDEKAYVTISSYNRSFPLFREGQTDLPCNVDKTGKFTYIVYD